VQLRDRTLALLREIQPLRAKPTDPVFVNTDGAPIENQSFWTHWNACMRALGIRSRGIYALQDTYVSNALTAGVNITWLEQQVGVSYVTIRRHYGRYLAEFGRREVEKLDDLCPDLCLDEDADFQAGDK
jgi:integrase